MTPEQWTAVDRYFAELFLAPDSILDAALHASAHHGLPEINVSPMQGSLLHLLARSYGARSMLEIGTLGGYSTIWLGRALPEDGRLVTLEIDPKHAAVARQNLEQAGLLSKVEIRIGPAIESLPALVNHPAAPFDLVFIDADKQSTAAYLEWALRLTRQGSVIIVDNIVRRGAVTDAHSDDANVQGMRRALAAMAAEKRLLVSAVQTVGSKGYDGFAIALVTGT
ncbi:MAG: O-methyltransferase [bacterium]|nr:O-methyltransferase [bacterium]